MGEGMSGVARGGRFATKSGLKIANASLSSISESNGVIRLRRHKNATLGRAASVNSENSRSAHSYADCGTFGA